MAAINKNFVIKNGLEVDTNLILADSQTNKVGIGTTVPQYTLHVNGGIGVTNLYVSGIATITTGIVTNLTSTNLNVTGIGTIVTGNITNLTNTNLNVTGIATIATLNATGIAVTNFTVYNSLSVGGISTFTNGPVLIGSGTSTGTASQRLQVTGGTYVSSNLGIGSTNPTSALFVVGDARVTGVITATTFSGNVNAGVGTITTLGSTNGTITNLNVTGISTLGTVKVSSGIITATSGIVTYFGDGNFLNLTSNPSRGIGIGTTGGVVGYAVTFIDFKGAGVSTTQYNSNTGIATIFFEGGGGGGSGSIGIGSTFSAGAANGDLFFHIDYGRIFVYYDEVTLGIGTDEYWIDAAPFNQGGLFVSKYGDNMFAGLGVTVGSLSSPSVYFNGYTNSGFYSPAANEFGVVVSGTQRLNVNSSGINVTGVATATTLSSTNLNVTNANITGVATATSFKGSAQVGVATGGTYIGLATQFNFVGSGIGITHAYDATVGIATITLTSTATGGGGGGDFNTGIASATAYAVTTGMSTAYTAPATAGARHIVHSIHVTNIDGTTSADISGQLYAGAYSIANTIPVPAGSAVELLKQPKILSPSETIQLQSSATGDLHATITVETKAGDTTYIGVGTDITSAATYTDLHIATANTMLQSVLLANDDGAADVKANVVWTDGSNNIQGYYAFEMTIPADATVEILEKPKFLPNGFKIRVLANQANRLEAILSAKTI